MILLRAVAETLRELAADPRHLSAEIGFIAVLHSWGRTFTIIAYPLHRAGLGRNTTSTTASACRRTAEFLWPTCRRDMGRHSTKGARQAIQ